MHREELDALVEEKRNQKLNEKKNNFELIQARRDYEEFKHQIHLNPLALKGAYSDNRATDSRIKAGQEVSYNNVCMRFKYFLKDVGQDSGKNYKE